MKQTELETPPVAPAVERLTYNATETCRALGIGRTTLWRLEKRGLIKSLPCLGKKLYPVSGLRQFASGKAA